MNKWLKFILITACCVLAVGLMLYSLYEKEQPAEPPAAAPGASNTATPAATPSGSPSASPSTTPSASTPATVDEAGATAIYKSNCLACHGDQLQGTMGPPLAAVGSAMTADQIQAQITNGGGGMPAFKGTLTDEQIQTLTNWLAAKK